MSDVDDFLAHYGVLGMKWGVRKDRSLQRKFENFSDKQKYGSMNEKEERIEDQGFFKSLTPAQKRAALIFGGAVVVAGVAYGTSRYVEGVKLSDLRDPRDLLDGGDPFDGITGAQKEGLLAYRDTGVSLPAGSLVARVSSDIETNIRPNGFYAAHEPHDIGSYVSWMGQEGGHVNYFKAVSEVKAPSTREYVESLARAMDHPDILKEAGVNPRLFKELSSDERAQALTRLATEELSSGNFAFSLNASAVDGVLPKRFVEDIRKNGFTSVIDYHNASPSVAQAPLRHLDGTMFKFERSEPITKEFKQAAKQAEDLYLTKIEEFYDTLVHAGLMFAVGFFLAHKQKSSTRDLLKDILGGNL